MTHTSKKPAPVALDARGDSSAPTLSTAQQIAVLGRLSQGALAELLDISTRQIRDTPELPKGEQGYSGPSCVRAWFARKLKQATKVTDAMLVGDGSGSPALERYREERAKMARLDRLEREKVLVNYSDIIEFINGSAAHLRRLGEQFQRLGMMQAFDMLQEVIEDIHRSVAREQEKRDEAREFTADDDNDGGELALVEA